MVRWVIQENLISEEELGNLVSACDKASVLVEYVKVIPFSSGLPFFTIDELPNVYYGSTTFITNVHEQLNPIGVFFDEETFSIKNYVNKWGNKMLSSEARFVRFGDFAKEDNDPKDMFFIRPDADDKSFSGTVVEFGDIEDWYQSLIKCDTVGLDENTEILVGPAYSIKKEWRNYIVEGRVATSSRYREGQKLSKSSTDIPDEMLEFVYESLKEYQPHEVFAMDIGLCGDEYYIIECGCMNSVGLYHSDVYKYVSAISDYVEKKVK